LSAFTKWLLTSVPAGITPCVKSDDSSYVPGTVMSTGRAAVVRTHCCSLNAYMVVSLWSAPMSTDGGGAINVIWPLVETIVAPAAAAKANAARSPNAHAKIRLLILPPVFCLLAWQAAALPRRNRTV
jgi:hypothetical protein